MRLIDGHRVVLDPEISRRMGRVRQRDTSAERIVRRVVHRLGLRFRIRNRDLPGSPDLANRRNRWVVFVHGCFWHRHPGCARATIPKKNRSFWEAKFEKNRARDRRVAESLRELGYRVVVVWECETRDVEAIAGKFRDLGAPRRKGVG